VPEHEKREQLFQELTAKLSEYREASRLGGIRTLRASPASAVDINRLNLDRLMRLHAEIAALCRSIEALPRPDDAACRDRRAQLTAQLEAAERALAGFNERQDDRKRDALELEVRHLSLLLELT